MCFQNCWMDSTRKYSMYEGTGSELAYTECGPTNNSPRMEHTMLAKYIMAGGVLQSLFVRQTKAPQPVYGVSHEREQNRIQLIKCA